MELEEKMQIQAASAVAPATTHKRAMEHIVQGLKDEVLGPIGYEKIQLCPQHAGYISDSLIDFLLEEYPGTEFRLHASPKLRNVAPNIVYVSNAPENGDYINESIRINERLGAGGYSLHAGERQDCTIEQMVENLAEIQSKTNIPVAVEGLYPSASNKWLMSDWREYEYVAEQGCKYALDLSHLNIVAKRHGQNDVLVKNLLESDQCIEIHVSGNDGRADSHKPLDKNREPWWIDALRQSKSKAVIFYEGILVDPRNRSQLP